MIDESPSETFRDQMVGIIDQTAAQLIHNYMQGVDIREKSGAVLMADALDDLCRERS